MREPTQEYLHECFEYRNGELWWKERPRHHFKRDQDCKMWNTRYKNTLAGKKPKLFRTDRSLRFVIKIKNTLFYRSRLVYIMKHGFITQGKQIDHKNGITTDDRIENLREVTNEENQNNRNKRLDNTTGTNGVGYRKDGRKKPWFCTFYLNGKQRSKSFYTKEEAIKFREEWEANHPHMTDRHGR